MSLADPREVVLPLYRRERASVRTVKRRGRSELDREEIVSRFDQTESGPTVE
jgi:hypothetical protein